MSSSIGGISLSSSSLTLNKINSLQTKMDNVELGSTISQSASELIDAIKTGISTQFSESSLRSINTLFNQFQSLLETEHPDILMDILSAMRHSGFQAMDDSGTSDTRTEDTAAAAGAHLAHIIHVHHAMSQLSATDSDDDFNDPISQITNDRSAEAQSGALSAFLIHRIAPPADVEDASLRATFAESSPNGQRLASAEAGSLSAMLEVGEIVTQRKTDKRANRSSGAMAMAKSQELIDAAIRKVQGYLSDGIDGITELSQIAECLSEIPNVAISCPNLLDEIHDAVIEYLQSQIGQLSESETRQLLTQVNEMIGAATGGTTLFSDEEIEGIVDAMNPSNIGEITIEEDDAELSQSQAPLPDDISILDQKPIIPTAASNAAGSILAKPLDINLLMSSSQITTHAPLVSASAETSGDTSSDRNEALRKVSHVVDFLEKLCENGLDQVLHRLTKQLDQTGLGALLRSNGEVAGA
jgi:hypothetical protein